MGPSFSPRSMCARSGPGKREFSNPTFAGFGFDDPSEAEESDSSEGCRLSSRWELVLIKGTLAGRRYAARTVSASPVSL